ncbi:MAG: hypothetical protein LBP29_05970 [Treponema sp.]|nr:hypothetical protein [Treponema sp.]
MQGGESVSVPAATPGGTISYYGTVSATPPFGAFYTNLTIESGANAAGITSALNVSGVLTVEANLSAASLSVTGTSTISAPVAAPTQTYTGAVTLGNDVTFTANTLATFTGGITGATHNATITGNAALGGTTSGVGALQISGTAAITGSGVTAASVSVGSTSTISAPVTTSGAQTYTGAVTLGADLTFTANAGSLVRFGNTVGGAARSLSVATANARFDGAVGGGSAATALSTVSVTGTSVVNADIRTSGNQTYTGAVTLGGSGNPRTFTATGGGADISFGSLITSSLKNLTVSAGDTVHFAGTVSGIGDGSTATAITVTADTLIIAAGMSSSAYKNISLTADTYNLTGATINVGTGTVYLYAKTTGNTIEFGPTQTTFTASSGTPSYWAGAAADVFIDSSVITAGTVVVGGTTQTGGIWITASSTTYNLTAQNSGTGFIDIGDYSSTRSLTLTAGSRGINFYESSALTVNTTGAQTYSGNSFLWAGTTLTSTGSVTFGTINSGSATHWPLVITNNAVFGGVIGGSRALDELTVGGTTVINTTAITTDNGQTYTGAVTLGSNVTFTASAGNLVWFKSTVGRDGTARLLTVATANAQFDGLVGGGSDTTALSGVSVAGTSAVNATNIRTTGNQSYTGAVTLGNNVSFIAAGTATFSTGVKGNASLRTLAIGDASHATNAIFDGATGTNLSTINVYGTSTVNAGATVTATGLQTYVGAVTNNGAITAGPVATGSNAIVFNSNYSVGASGARNIIGNTTTDPTIVFKGNAAFGNFTHNGDTVQFSGTTHDVSKTGNGTFADVVIDTGNTVTVASGTTITQDPAGTGRTLTLTGTAVLDTTNGRWYIGPSTTLTASWRMLSDPSLSTSSTFGYGDPNYIYTSTNRAPVFSTGFAGFNGNLIMGNGSTLNTNDFYTQMTDNPVTHQFTLTAPSVALQMCDILASGNVTVNQSFLNVANSTLTMTTDGKELAVRSHAASPARIADVRLGNFVVAAGTSGSPILINSSVIFAGGNGVTINSGTVLTTYTDAYIQLNPDTGLTGSKWVQTGATFDLSGGKRPIVEFGIQGNSTGRTFEISGTTTWYDLVCKEPKATLKFSNHPDLHSVAGEFLVVPLNAAGTDFEGGGGSGTNPYMIELTRLVGPPTHPPVPPFAPDTQPSSAVNANFWWFELKSGAKLSLNYVYLHYSWAKNRIPLPLEGRAIILAIPYVYMAPPLGSPVYALSNPRADPTADFDNATKESYYNHNWLVANNFFYSFTEDSNHNGRIDRIRAQAAFDLYWDPAPGNTFSASVAGYEVDTTRPGGAYKLGTEASNTDCLYIYLKEKDYSDTDAPLVWRVEQNTALKDWATKSINIGLPEHPPMTTWDTAPPRLNYALTYPVVAGEQGEIYIQFSEPVKVPSIGVTTSPPATEVRPAGTGDKDILVTINLGYTVTDLVKDYTAYPKFIVTGVEDKAVIVRDLKSQDGVFYAYLYPSPKYPKDWSYTEYVEISGNGSISFPFTVITPSATPILLPEVKTKTWTPSVSGNWLDNEGDSVTPPYGNDTHRVTDILISKPPVHVGETQYFAWPLWVKHNRNKIEFDGQIGKIPATDYGLMNPNDPFNDSDIIWDFTGKRFLEQEDMTLQARLGYGLLSSLDPVLGLGLVFAPSVDPLYKRGHSDTGLWLPKRLPSLPPPPPPPLGTREFSNLVPYVLSLPLESLKYVVSASLSPPLFNYTLSRNELAPKSNLEFFFHLSGTPTDLFAGRLDILPGETIPPDWYNRVKPFVFGVHDITRQRGGVTILNNVINSVKREHVLLDYKLDKTGRVTVQVFTMDGNLVKVLVRQTQSARESYYRVSWDGTNNGGRPVARGMYFIRIVAPDIDEIRKVMVVK